jgi:hypothetical protein
MEIESEIDHVCIPALTKTIHRDLPIVAGQPISDYKVELASECISVSIVASNPLLGILPAPIETTVDGEYTFGLIYSKMDEEPYILI